MCVCACAVSQGIIDLELNKTDIAEQVQKYSYAQIIKALWDEHVRQHP